MRIKLGLRSFHKASHRRGNQISLGTFGEFKAGFRWGDLCPRGLLKGVFLSPSFYLQQYFGVSVGLCSWHNLRNSLFDLYILILILFLLTFYTFLSTIIWLDNDVSSTSKRLNIRFRKSFIAVFYCWMFPKIASSWLYFFEGLITCAHIEYLSLTTNSQQRSLSYIYHVIFVA